MKTTCKLATLVAALITLGMLQTEADGSIDLTITEDGGDLIMTATGTYDVSALTPDLQLPLGPKATINNDLNLFGWDAGSLVDAYTVNFTGSFTSNNTFAQTTAISTTNPFFFYINNISTAELVFAQGAPTIGSVNESATFSGVTLLSLGMVAGETITLNWSGDSATISTIIAPEPSSALLLGLGLLGFASRRRRSSQHR